MKTAIMIVIVLAGVAHAEGKPSCVVEKPVVVAPPAIKAPPCHKAPAKVEKAITAEIVKQFTPEQGGKPDVKYACDGLGPKIFEIVLEAGSGHGGSLNLWRAKRRADGKFTVRGIGFEGLHPRKPGVVDIRGGVVELPDLDKVRAAMTATVKEIVPPPKPGEVRARSASFSSRDFHLVLRLVDDEGRVVEKRYTGYTSSDKQNLFLGLEVAQGALSPIWKLEPDPALAIEDDDRAFFAVSFNAAVPYFDDQFFWWVMERYVRLARSLGTPKIIGGLLTRLTVADKDNRSKVDARVAALEALATITGWDAREGKLVDEASKLYLETCK